MDHAALPPGGAREPEDPERAPGAGNEIAVRFAQLALELHRCRAFHAFWLADDRVVAGMQVSLWDDGIAPVQELIRAKQPVDPDRMADASVPLVAHVMA